MIKTYNYLLFVFEDFRQKDKVVETIALQLSSMSHKSSYVKYNYGDYGMVINFVSEMSFYEIRDYVEIILGTVTKQYFFMEKPKKFHAFMPSDLKLNLFDLYGENKDLDNNVSEKGVIPIMDMFMHNITKTLDESFSLSDEELQESFEKIMFKVDYGEDKPSIDEILDKIKDKGLDSLTKYEKQILDEYSKK